MNRYIITEKAGLRVAGFNNPGVGTVIEMTPEAAEAELARGAIVAEPEVAEASEAAAPADGGENTGEPEKAPAKGKK